MNNISTISGAGIALIVHQMHTKRHTNQPMNPHIRLEDTPDLDWKIFDMKSQSVITTYYLRSYKHHTQPAYAYLGSVFVRL